MLVRRAALLEAVRDAFPGFVEARLTKREDGSWFDVWRWDGPPIHGVVDREPAAPGRESTGLRMRRRPRRRSVGVVTRAGPGAAAVASPLSRDLWEPPDPASVQLS